MNYSASRKRLRARFKRAGVPLPVVCYTETCGHLRWPERMCPRGLADRCAGRTIKRKATK